MDNHENYLDKVRQENLFIFDEKYRTVKGFKEDLNGLLADYSTNKERFVGVNLRGRSRLSPEERDEVHSKIEGMKKMGPEVFHVFYKRITDFIRRYDLGSEWVLHLISTSLTGHFDVPDRRYAIRYDEESPGEVCIRITQRTTTDDLKNALREAQHLLPESKDKRHYSKYSSLEDPDFIDAAKKIEIDHMNIKPLSWHEEHDLYKPDDLDASMKSIYAYRKAQKERGQITVIKTPEFKKKMSDKDFLKGIFKGAEIKKAAERLKKNRQRFQKKIG